MTINLDFWPTAAFAAVLLCWLIFAAAFIFRAKPPATKESKREPASITGIALQAASYGVAWGVHRQYFTPITGMSERAEMVVAVLTILVASLSVWMVVAAVRRLGKEWSLTARLVEGHRLVTGGPYRLVRNPIYTGMLGMLLATALVTSHLVALVLALTIFIVGTHIRVRSEEKLLREAFGAEFEAYARKVPAIIPRPF